MKPMRKWHMEAYKNSWAQGWNANAFKGLIRASRPYKALKGLTRPLRALYKNLIKNHGFKTLFSMGKLKAQARNHMKK